METDKISYFYLPKELIHDEKYKSFAIEAKLLFAMVFTCAEKNKFILDLADFIKAIGENKLKKLRKEYADYCKEMKENEQSDIN